MFRCFVLVQGTLVYYDTTPAGFVASESRCSIPSMKTGETGVLVQLCRHCFLEMLVKSWRPSDFIYRQFRE